MVIVLNKNEPRKYKSDLILFLDLDNTLIKSQKHAIIPSDDDDDDDDNFNTDESSKIGIKKTDSLLTESAPYFTARFSANGFLYIVHKRPGLDAFLRNISGRFETHVFTAATKVYANAILDELDPSGTVFDMRWFRDSCTPFHEGDVNLVCGHYKDIQNLPAWQQRKINPKRFVIVDDQQITMKMNLSNGIVVSAFENTEEQQHDQVLCQVWDLLSDLDDVEDVRPVLEEMFNLRRSLVDIQSAELKEEDNPAVSIPIK
jgi:TFIIF-interacting CTD phosphatase-like protein